MGESFDGDLGRAAAEFMMAATRCTDIEALDQHFRLFVQGQGFTSAMFVHLTTSGAPVTPRVVFGDHDPWVAHYNERKYARLDPTIPRAFTSRHAFTWDEVERPDGPQAERDFFGEAREVWARAGLVVPHHGPRAEFSVVNLLSDRKILLAARHRAVFEAASKVYVSQGLTLLTGPLALGPTPKMTLTPREQACVYWMALGKTDWEIGRILEVSPNTVRTYIEHAKVKLGVYSRPQLATKAVTLGYVVPNAALLA